LSDFIIRGITQDNYVRFFAVDSTFSSNEVMESHNLSITAATIFSRMLSAGFMLGATLKAETDILTMKIDGDGPINKALVTAKANGTVKGFIANPQLELKLDNGKINVKKAIGSGTLTMIKDLGMRTSYNSQVELISGEIAEDIAYYYAKSEQIPTSIGLGVLFDKEGQIRKSGGFMIQLMPETPENIIVEIEKNLSSFPNLSDLLDMNYEIEKIVLKMILKGLNAKVQEKKEVRYYCDCSRERFSSGLKLLKLSELEEMTESEETLIECRFCLKKYTFSPQEIKSFIEEKEIKNKKNLP